MDDRAKGEQTPRRSQRPEELLRGLSHTIGDSGEEPIHQPLHPHAILKPGPCPHPPACSAPVSTAVRGRTRNRQARSMCGPSSELQPPIFSNLVTILITVEAAGTLGTILLLPVLS